MAENSLFAMLRRASWWVSIGIAAGIARVARIVFPDRYAVIGAFTGLPFAAIGAIAAWKRIRAPGTAPGRGTCADAALGRTGGEAGNPEIARPDLLVLVYRVRRSEFQGRGMSVGRQARREAESAPRGTVGPSIAAGRPRMSWIGSWPTPAGGAPQASLVPAAFAPVLGE
jgi:hypothetical protein